MKKSAKPEIRIACAQINPVVGDLNGNFNKILHFIDEAKKKNVDIICFPELALTGYPPEDLLLRPSFLKDNLNYLDKLVSQIEGIVVVVGFVDFKDKNIFNAAAVIENKKIKFVYHKMLLPNYSVFDEKRYFTSGIEAMVFEYKNYKFGVNICEDIWFKNGPVRNQVKSGAKVILNLNASPYYYGKNKLRNKIVENQAKDNKVFVVYTNLVGGQDELVFDGRSKIISPDGKIVAEGKAFEEDLLIYDLNLEKNLETVNIIRELNDVEEIYKALCLGLKDYVCKNGFKKVVLGLSGGIDSALVATIAADCLGKENVVGIFMPSRYSSKDSEDDAKSLASNLGIEVKKISIEYLYKSYLLILEEHFVGTARDITEENLQARIRGNILMAFSNKFGWLVLTTGNKSEMSTGYSTLYGDMAGGFALIKDVEKLMVYKLAEYRNTISKVVPDRIIIKAPTAELRDNQKDSDSLPEYKELDPILKAYVEDEKSLEEILVMGYKEEAVKKVIKLVDKSEYKRRQSPPGVKITPRALGKDRRMPITCKLNY